jgi:hypothetical protein
MNVRAMSLAELLEIKVAHNRRPRVRQTSVCRRFIMLPYEFQFVGGV